MTAGLPAVDEATDARWAAGLRRFQAVLDTGPADIALWYPVTPDSRCAPLEYEGAPALFRLPELALDAPPADTGGRSPLVLLCGDRGRDALDLGWLGVHLARLGCRVAAAPPPRADGAAFVDASCRQLHTLASVATEALPGAGAPSACEYAVAGLALGGIAALVLAGATLEARDEDAGVSLGDARVAALALLNPAPAALIRGGYAAVGVPVHVLVSAADRVAPPVEHGERIAAALRGARLTRLAAPAGHHVFHSEGTLAGRRAAADRAADHAAVHRGSLHERCAALVSALVHEALPAAG